MAQLSVPASLAFPREERITRVTNHFTPNFYYLQIQSPKWLILDLADLRGECLEYNPVKVFRALWGQDVLPWKNHCPQAVHIIKALLSPALGL